MTSPWLVVASVLAGLALGWAARFVIVWQSQPQGLRCCPGCHQAIWRCRGWLPAVPPASGRCAQCHGRIGPPPLSAELTMAALLGLLTARLGSGLLLLAACWLALCAVPLAFIDAATRRLPDVLTGAAYAGTAALLAADAAAGSRWTSLARALAGGAVLAGFYLLPRLISPAGVGLGDVKLAASLGTALTWAGWEFLYLGTLAAFLLGALYGVGRIAARRGSRKQSVPFGPFMVAGAFLALLAAGAG